MVLLAKYRILQSSAGHHRIAHVCGVAFAQQANRDCTFRFGGRTVLDCLSWDSHQSLANDRSLPLQPLGSSLGAEYAGFSGHRDAFSSPGYFDVHGLVILGFSRQSSCGHRISLGTRIILGHLFSEMPTGLSALRHRVCRSPISHRKMRYPFSTPYSLISTANRMASIHA